MTTMRATSLLRPLWGLLIAGMIGWLHPALAHSAPPGTSTTQPGQTLNVVATTGMIADLVSHIGGDKVTVTALMGSGVDPHLYKATQGDLRKLLRADVIFYNGLHLEGKMQEIFSKMTRKKAVYAVADALPADAILQHENAPDPHIWFDVTLWRQAAQAVLSGLQATAPHWSDTFADNAGQYFTELEALHLWTQTQIARIPPAQRILITAHDAFGYLGRAYGLEVKGLQGISTAAEFGLQDIKQLKDVIVTHRIRAVFVESSVSPRFIESLVKGVAAEGHQLSIGGELYSDAMGLPGTPEGTYVGMVRHNVNTIVSALTGQKPEESTP